MKVDPQLVAELRALFREGATPSRLIGHVLARHAGEEKQSFLLREYFREAFSVPMVRVPARVNAQDLNGLSLAYLNAHLVHQILEKRPLWDSTADPPTKPGNPWLDSLPATSEVDLIEQVRPASAPELAHSWDRLDSEAQRFIQRIMGNANALYERVAILARLAERLQQRVIELENQLRERSEVASGPMAPATD